MDSQDNRKFFPNESNSEVNLENIFKTLDTGVSYKGSFDRFYSSVNDIIGAFNQRSLDRSTMAASKISSMEEGVLKRENENEIISHMEEIQRLQKSIYSFIGDTSKLDKSSSEYKSVANYAQVSSDLTSTFKSYEAKLKDLRDMNSQSAVDRGLKEDDPLFIANKSNDASTIDPHDLANQFSRNYSIENIGDSIEDTYIIGGSHEHFYSSIDRSFASGRPVISSDFSDYQKQIIMDTAEVGNILNQINVLHNSTPTFSNKGKLKKLVKLLKEKNAKNIPPQARAAIYLTLYQNEVES